MQWYEKLSKTMQINMIENHLPTVHLVNVTSSRGSSTIISHSRLSTSDVEQEDTQLSLLSAVIP